MYGKRSFNKSIAKFSESGITRNSVKCAKLSRKKETFYAQ